MAVLMPTFLQAQPQGNNLIQRSYLEWLEEQENERAAKYVQCRAYYDGDHETQLTDRMRKFLELKAGQDFSINVCPIVVDSLAEKLKVDGFICESGADLFKEWWKANRMDGQQGVVHLAAVRDGDTYVLIEWDNELKRPVFTQENAWDGTQGMHIVYSDEHRMLPVVAIKRWNLASGVNVVTRRTNLYYPDRIEKYSDGGGGDTWLHYDDGSGQWPIWWTDNDLEGGTPLGIPVIHFRNKDQGYSYGQSEEDPAIPLQNGGNKALIDTLSAADTTGFRNYWMTGGKPDGIVTAPGSWFYSENPDASFGAIDAADLTSLIALKDSIIADIGKVTRTPLSSFQLTGAIAAAGTLKEQRAGLDAKIEDRQTTFGNAWEDVMAFGRKLANIFGSAKLDETKLIATTWMAAEEPTDLDRATEVELLNRSGAASTETKVRKLHPDWEDAKVKVEVDLIHNEAGMLVPDIGPVAG